VVEALAGTRYVAESIAALRGDMDAREAAFAQEAALGAVRHAVTLDHVLAAVARYDPRRVEPEVRGLLLVAAYQVIWMDRVPLFAAVDESVALARRTGSRRAGGMVNAILRRLTEAIESRRGEWRPSEPRCVRVDFANACWFRLPVLPPPEPDPVAHIAAAAGELPQRFAELTNRLGFRMAEQAAWASQGRPPVVLNRNLLRIDTATFASGVSEELGESTQVEGDTAWIAGSAGLAHSRLFSQGLAYVQDATARAAATLLDAKPGETVLDLCAAPGGKAVALALAMQNRGKLLAVDVDEPRLDRVRENVRRLGLDCIETRSAEELADAPIFDAAIVDVPCSNSGVIARRPEARFRLNERSLASLTELQSRLLAQAARQVRAGGRLVYSTCSIEPRENEGVVAAFLDASPQWQLSRSATTLPNWGARSGDWRDGGYAALLRRT
jgi:16S rRNA (cytosine967-C5)-methyltransferase